MPYQENIYDDPTVRRSPKDEKRFQQMQEDIALAAKNKAAPYDLATSQAQAQQAQLGQSANVMRGDINAWMGNPAYRTSYANAPQEFRQHLIDAYGAAAAEAPSDVNTAARAATGNPQIGLEGLPTGEEATVKMDDGVTARINSQKPPAEMIEEGSSKGVYREGMNAQQLQDAISQYNTSQGVIPKEEQPAAARIAARVKSDPILGPFAKQKAAFDTMTSGMQDPQGHGFDDMALIEGFQRIVNPGAIVRQATMNNMLHAAGLGQYGSWDFLVNKIQNGDKLSPEVRQRLYALAQTEYTKATRAANAQLAGLRTQARMFGIPNPDNFINSVVTYVGNDTDEGSQVADPNAAAPQPSGDGSVQVDTQEQYDALPSGAQYKDSNGVPGVKP
jgi:hypothetical protein